MKLLKVGLVAALVASALPFFTVTSAHAQGFYVTTQPGYVYNNPDWRYQRWLRHHEMRRLYDHDFDRDNDAWRWRRWNSYRGYRRWY